MKKLKNYVAFAESKPYGHIWEGPAYNKREAIRAAVRANCGKYVGREILIEEVKS